MANQVFNISKGKVNELVQNVVDDEPTAASILRVVLCTGTETDDNIEALDNWSVIKAGLLAEATFTNYTAGGKSVANPTVGPVDDTNDKLACDMPDQTWTAAGNGTNNTLTRLITLYDVDGVSSDVNLVPLTFHDFAVTTDGSDLTAQFAAGGFFEATQG